MSKRYEQSELMLERAMNSIPLGAQTYSKSITQFPYGISPYFASRGEGAYLYDIDGNKYIDFINSQASVTLGYNDPDINLAVKKQLEQGSIFSLSHTIETQVAEKIIEMVPCAEMVRFGKNGSDATAGAVRIARAYTNKEYVAVCGYHGWQDWYIGSTSKDLGVPNAVKELTLKFEYNDIQSLQTLFEQYSNKIAAVILEPMNAVEPAPGFLKNIKTLTHQNNAVLIFDEMITGFRYTNGGAQEYFGVTPDLATFGKGIANGFPVSAVVGKKDIMMLMEEVFFSFTFGGETLSLAAALATLNKLQKEPVIKRIKENGTKIIETVNKLIESHKLKDVISVSGHPSWSFLNIENKNDYSNLEIKTYLMQELFKRGILMYGTHNMSYAHSSEDLRKLFLAYDEVFSDLSSTLASKSLLEQLNCNPLKPLFKVRD
ncbi:aminotransferase class III-fold pyridoxal phosphate-dependent enzyme [Oceanobacillus saliphilus]|uniref:aminotransferase class III-fold pyridoxal phosphate-dependent enzyme n=1 Tax=Oceanobacillus saliphilus TaxID=2925834 RepID=UPI00201D639C|nr:aminotransferase class III-fold pyridoxal phosphate-dependent enzyme [Oceanobacillus saliphilus]